MSRPHINQVSMSQRLTLALVVTMTFIAVLVATGFYLLTEDELERTFTRKVEQTVSYLEGTLAPILWNFDHNTAAGVAKTVLRENLIVGVTVLDENKKIVFSDREESEDAVLVRTHSIRFEDKIVGELELVFSRDALVDNLTNILWVSLSAWLLSVIGITLLTNIFIRKYFRGPLISFTDLAKAYRQHPESTPKSSTPYLEFQPIEEVVKNLANDVFDQLEELKESEAYYRSIFENALYGIAITGPDFKFTKVNESWCRLIGYSEEELLNNMGIADVTLPDNMPESKEMMKKLINREVREGRLEKRYRTKSGEIVEAMTFVKGIYDENDRYLGNAASILDITERKQAEIELEGHREHLEELVEERTRKLAESEKKYADLYENAPDMFASIDAKTGKIMQCNQTFLNKTNYSKDELIGQPIYYIYHPDCLGKAKASFEQFKTSGAVQNAELKIKRKDGTALEVILNVTAIRDENGKPIYSRSIWVDISVRKEAERRVLEAKETLEMANERLKELDRLKSMFIGSMSHEFRTPLNSIIGFTGILLMEMVGKLEPKQKDFLKRANQSAKHLLSLITDIIDISKIEAGKIDTFNSQFVLGEVIDEAVDNIEPMRNKKGLDLHVNVPDNFEIHNDRKRVYQCILNFLSNSIKYSEKGWVSISARQLNEEVEIVVEDTGIGIAEKDIPNIFQPFERLNSSLRNKELGTGLGLYLTKKMASEILGGSVKVESQLGVGSKFSLYLPTHRQIHEQDTNKSRWEQS
jgi:PAS domain S-box-containing protein